MFSTNVVARALAERQFSGAPGNTSARLLGRGEGWSAKDIVCTHDRNDRPFEERHGAVSVALVLAGTFQYRCDEHNRLMAPGALMLGNYGECFECSHDHAAGDRCIAFHYTPEYFERIAADAGYTTTAFATPRIPPLRELGRVGGLVSAKLLRHDVAAWEDVALSIAARALALARHDSRDVRTPSRKLLARITESIRTIEANPSIDRTIQDLAKAAGVGPYYYLRVFERVTGVTPHQFILRARLRAAATRIAGDDDQIARIAYASGFGDLSNFNHTFRAEFGVTPRQWRGQFA